MIWSLIAGGLLGMLAMRAISGWSGAAALLALPALPEGRNALPWADLSPASALKWAALLAAATAPVLTLGALGLFFLKVGSVLYGSGYVLVAFLEGELVHEYGWLTQQQLLDAIAIGQFTPGPVLSTAAFIGYVLAGVPGAFISAAAIFAPSFLFVAILNPIVPRLRRSAWMAAFLDAVNVSAVGLMAAVLLRLTGDIVTAWARRRHRPPGRRRSAALARHLRLGRHRRRPARLAAVAARLVRWGHGPQSAPTVFVSAADRLHIRYRLSEA